MKDRLIDPFGDHEPIDIELGPNGELPEGFRYVDPDEFRDMSFREWCAVYGLGPKPDDTWAPEDVGAWFMDEKLS